MRANVTAILITALCLTTYFGCITAPDYPVEPTLTFVSFSKTAMNQGRSLNDSIFMVLDFTDGDGDLGSGNEINFTLIDSRTGDDYGRFRVPPIPEAGANNGVNGTMTVKIFNTCCLEPDGDEVCEDVTVALNELAFDVVLTDRAGNASNTLRTPTINLICN